MCAIPAVVTPDISTQRCDANMVNEATFMHDATDELRPYLPGQTCKYRLAVPELLTPVTVVNGRVLQAKFNYIDLLAGDSLAIYDGFNDSAPLLRTIVGPTVMPLPEPLVIVASSGYLYSKRVSTATSGASYGHSVDVKREW